MFKKQISTVAGILMILFLVGVVGASVLLLNQKEEKIILPESEVEDGEEATEIADSKFCKTAEDCHLSYCLNNEYVEKTFLWSKEEGMITDFTEIPPNASCICQENKCVVIINQEEREKIREKMTINKGLDDFPNLINYRGEIRTDYIEKDLAEIGRFDITIDENLIKDKDVLTFNINLPGDLNLIVERKSFLMCEDDERIENHLCKNNQYTWKGVISESKTILPAYFVYIYGSDEGVFFEVSPANFHIIENNKNKYVYRVRKSNLLIVRENSGF